MAAVNYLNIIFVNTISNFCHRNLVLTFKISPLTVTVTMFN